MEIIPDRGDLIWLTVTPQAGHEQAGRRPAVVISPVIYNEKTSLALVCPITSQINNYPFEVRIPENQPIKGVILSDQIKNLDWRARQAEIVGRVDEEKITEVIQKIMTLLD